MSLYDYKQSIEIDKQDYPFYGLIMAAMRKADYENIQKLITAFPDVYKEFNERYNSPGGLIGREKYEM